MISDLLESLRGFKDKRIRLCFYIGDGGGLHYFTEVGYIREVSDHKVVLEPDPTVEDDSLSTMITLFTEFVAIYAIDLLDPEKPITPEARKPGEFDDVVSVKDVSPNEADQWLSQGYVIQNVYQKNLILVKRKTPEGGKAVGEAEKT